MSDLTLESFDLDEEIALLEKRGGGPDMYYAHSNMHSMAFSKYANAAKQAQTTGNAAHAKKLRAVGKLHKRAAETLAQIAGHHVDHQFSREQAARKAMPGKLQEESEMTDEVEKNPIQELIGFAITQKPHQFNEAVQGLIRSFVAESVERVRRELFEIKDEDEDEQSVLAGEDDDELSEEAILESMTEEELDALNEELELIEGLDEEAIDELFGKGKLPAIRAHHEKQARIKHAISDVHNREYDRSGDDRDLDNAMSHGIEGDEHEDSVHRANALQRRANAGAAVRKAKAELHKAADATHSHNYKYKPMKEDADQIEEISVPPTGKTVKGDKGPNVGEGDQGPRTLKKVKFSKKKPEQKSVSVSAGDTFRTKEAAD